PFPRIVRVRPSLTHLTLAALVAGAAFGAVAPAWAPHLGVLTRLFVRLLQMVVTPLVFATLAVGVAGSDRRAPLRRLAVATVAYFAVTSIAASLVGLAAGNVLLAIVAPGPLMAGAAGAASPAAAPASFLDLLVPASIVRAMADNNLLALVFFTVLFSLVLRQVPERTAAPLLTVLEALATVMTRLAGALMWTAPVAVFAAIAVAVSTNGWSGVRAFGALVIVTYASLFAFAVVVLWVSSRIGRFRPAAFLRSVAGALTVAFSTASGAAALPGAMEELERSGVSRRTIGFVLPLGYSFNLMGPAVYVPLVTLFWAHVNGVSLDWAHQALLVGLTFVVIRGIPPIPRGLFFVWGGLLAQLHLPLEGLVIMLGIDPLTDMARTLLNVGGNCLAVATLDGALAPRHDPATP
ncbi:MAG TPA: dicarboxylate/amino acid:cation symporter, partial [Gemmatimonadaceae bacterium]|nr:dicarboxylate/amino acid:cation symporter [Gemmatimonadaceae bacterium]